MIPERIGAEETDQNPAPPRPPVIEAQDPIVVEAPDRGYDLVLLAAVLALVAIGTVEVFSASATYALKKSGDSSYFLTRQLAWLGLGMAALLAGARTDYRWLRRATYPLLVAAVLALAAVLVVGARINNARRWFVFGPLSFQPVEIAKLALIAFLSYSLAKKADKVKTFTVGFAPHLVVMAVMVVLLLKQPDLGSAIILTATTLTLLFVAGAKVSYLLLAVLAGAPVAYHFIVGTPWRMRRFLAFFNPEAFRDGVAYQIVQSQIAIGSGGLTGVGLGAGRQQLGYMPEGHSDFIMSSIGEELGFIGFIVVLALFVVVLWRGVRAALGARDAFGGYLAFGITASFAFQALINTGVVLGSLPAKGLTLPFVSYGGSSLLVSLFLAGVLLNVARRAAPAPVARAREVVNRVSANRRRRRAVILVGDAPAPPPRNMAQGAQG